MSLPFPKKASGWKDKHLSELKISYDDESTNLSDFMALLKRGTAQTDLFTNELPATIVRLIDCTKKYWNFSFDFDIRRTGGKRNTDELRAIRENDIENGITNAEQCMKNLQKEDLAEFKELRNLNDHKR